MQLKSLKDRALLLAKAREFFAKRGVLEVDCDALMPSPPNDAHIEVMSTEIAPGQVRYLHTSPEYAMKKLLAAGSPDIYYLGHVFRYGDIGKRHTPEFTMVEWYRKGFSLEELIRETAQFMELFLGKLPLRLLGYHEAFKATLGIDCESLEQLKEAANEWKPSAKNWGLQDYRHFLLSHAIEPTLGSKELTALVGYPADEAALACIVDGKAERFEIYHEGVELCNGYHELSDPVEMKRRFEMWNRQRKEAYPIDESFLASLSSLPDCSGVSVGFDRLMNLCHKT